MKHTFRTASPIDLEEIWTIIQQAIRRRKADGSNQWQDGYPNSTVIQQDIDQHNGFVLCAGDKIVGYCAVLLNDEPEYANIQGNWITNGDFVVVHRVAISEQYIGQGLAKEIMKHVEDYAIDNSILSIKADTNFDNMAMMKTFEKLGYVYCGEVFFRGSPRRAYEKVLQTAS